MKFSILFITFIVAGSLIGCNAGMAPPDMSETDAKAAIDKMPPEQKIKAIANSPLPSAEKEKRYAEIEKETGVKAKDVLGGAPTGMPGSGN